MCGVVIDVWCDDRCECLLQNMRQALRYLGDIHDAQLDFDTLKEFPDVVRTIRKVVWVVGGVYSLHDVMHNIIIIPTLTVCS